MIVAVYLGHGWSADQIAEQYPHLKLSEIHSAMAYYFDHPDEIHRTLEEEIRDRGAAQTSLPDS